MNEDPCATIVEALVAGGMTRESSEGLASFLSQHYGEHAAVIASYLPPIEPVETPIEEVVDDV